MVLLPTVGPLMLGALLMALSSVLSGRARLSLA